MPRRLFVTTALPYANGPFHIGHIMEYIQADIWVRFQRMQGHEVHFIGADDARLVLHNVMAARDQGGSSQGLYVAAKGGHNDESHNHNDNGNFVINNDGSSFSHRDRSFLRLRPRSVF